MSNKGDGLAAWFFFDSFDWVILTIRNTVKYYDIIRDENDPNFFDSFSEFIKSWLWFSVFDNMFDDFNEDYKFLVDKFSKDRNVDSDRMFDVIMRRSVTNEDMMHFMNDYIRPDDCRINDVQ